MNHSDPVAVSTLSEIQSQLNKMAKLLDGLDLEIDETGKAFAATLLNADIVGTSAGPATAQPVPNMAPLTGILYDMNYRIENSLRLLKDMRTRCQL